jgi:hypothetical protein
VRRDGADHPPGDTVESLGSKPRPSAIPLRGRDWRSRIGLMESRSGLLLWLVRQAQQLSPSALYIGKGGQRAARNVGAGKRCHTLKLLRFQLAVENH